MSDKNIPNNLSNYLSNESNQNSDLIWALWAGKTQFSFTSSSNSVSGTGSQTTYELKKIISRQQDFDVNIRLVQTQKKDLVEFYLKMEVVNITKIYEEETTEFRLCIKRICDLSLSKLLEGYLLKVVDRNLADFFTEVDKSYFSK